MKRREVVRSSRPGWGSSQREVLFPSPARRRFRRLALERLEDRTLLAISHSFDPSTGLLVIESDADDRLYVSDDGEGHVTVNHVALMEGGQPLAAAAVQGVAVHGGPGENEINIFLSSAVFSRLESPVWVFGGQGNDTIRTDDEFTQAPFEFELNGGQGDDLIICGFGDHRLFGDDGNDSFQVSGENLVFTVSVDGGDGDDRLIGVSPHDQELTSDYWRLVRESASDWEVHLSNVEFATLTKIGSGEIRASDFRGDVILRAPGDHTRLYGGWGNDTLSAWGLSSMLYGGPGNDQLYAYRELSSLDGGPGDDQLIGSSGRDVLTGGNGNDLLSGAGGPDEYRFEEGSVATQETTTIVEIVDGSRNSLDFSSIFQYPSMQPYAVQVDLASSNIAVMRNHRVVTETPEAFWDVVGSQGDDWISGNERDNRLHGGLGNDWIVGRDGNDELFGGQGEDVLLGGVGNDVLRGGPGDDHLFGEDGDDHLRGEEGADVFVAGGGNDTTDAVADVAVSVSGPAEVRLGQGNEPVSVDVVFSVSNLGEDFANNVSVDRLWGGAFTGSTETWAPGTQVQDPVSGNPTGVRVLAPNSVTTLTVPATATRPGFWHVPGGRCVGRSVHPRSESAKQPVYGFHACLGSDSSRTCSVLDGTQDGSLGRGTDRERRGLWSVPFGRQFGGRHGGLHLERHRL